uniref:PWWP domain-containing protein n=1 Tax=Bursaphelenchus xylophilus TaxID=6326 RepID=A0A1I7SBW3_BURXY
MESMRTNEMPPKMDGPLPKMKTKRVKAKPAASSSDEGPKLEVGELVFALWSDSHWPAVVKQDRGAKVSIVFLPYKQRDQPFNKKKADLVFVESADQLVCPADCTNPEYKLAFAIGAHLYQLGPQKSAKILTTPLTPKQHTMAMQGKNITYEFLGDFKPEGDKEAAEEEEESVGLPQELIKTFKENKKSDLFKPRPKRKVGQSEESPAKKVSRTIPLNEKLFSKDLKKLSEEEMTCLEKNQVFLAEVLNPLNTGLWPVLVSVEIILGRLIQHCTDPILPNLRMTTADMIGTVINTHFESIWAGQAPIPHLKRHQLFLHHVFFTKRCHIFPRTEGCSADLYGLVDSELLERMYDEYMGMVRLANKIPRLTELERSKYIMQVMFPEAIEFAVAKKFGMDTETVEKFLAACDRVVSAREMRIDDPLALAEINSLLTKNCPTFFTDTHEQENRAESTENSPPIFLKSDVEAQ